MMNQPPFRADHVGSLLRPTELREARARARTGDISQTELKAVEARLVRDVVEKQAAVGLRSITDGEFQRDFWHLDFMGSLDGVTLRPQTSGHVRRRETKALTFWTCQAPCTRTPTERLIG